MIALSAVFTEIQQKNRSHRKHIFSVKYIRKDGTIGFKPRVSKVFVAEENALLNRTVSFYNYENGENFKIILDHWTDYNGTKIDHEK